MVLDRLRSTLFASKLHAAATILVGLFLVLVVAFLVGIVGTPGVAAVENRFGAVNDTATTIHSDVVVENPNPIGVQLGGTTIDYAVAMNGIEMATGSRSGIAVGSGRSTINLTTYLANERIPDWWRSHVDDGERTTVAVNADVHSSLLGASFGAPTIEREITTNLTDALNSTTSRPVNAGAPLVEDPVLYVNETTGRWGAVTESETEIEMTFTLYNPKPYPVPISELGYEVTMNDVTVGSGETERSTVIGRGESVTLEATTVIRNAALDEWWVTHVERNQVTEMTVAFGARIDLTATGAGSVDVPLDSTTQTLETDIFGTKGAASPNDGSGSTDATPSAGGDAPTGSDGDGSPDGTATPAGDTGTAAPGGDGETATPTDDPDSGGTESPTEGPVVDPLG